MHLETETVHQFSPRNTRYCIVIPVWNEGSRIRDQLHRMQPFASQADIILVDYKSTDGSTSPEFLQERGVNSLLITNQKGLGTSLRIGLSYAMERQYEGVITLDGNGKDGVDAIPTFIEHLDEGYDLVQGSRFLRGGIHKNTPIGRILGIHCFVAPLIALGGKWYTDPTNGFRAMSRKYLQDPRMQPLRPIFVGFNLQFYLIYRAAQLRSKIIEVPVMRSYPDDGSLPTKITSWHIKLRLVMDLLQVVFGRCSPAIVNDGKR